jgi:hypothetical protein
MTLESNEQIENAEHGAKDPFIGIVSITIALLAVITAVTSSLEQVEAGGAIVDSSRAVLAQNQASDSWAYYQAKSLKKHLYGIAGDTPSANAERYKKTSAKESSDSDKAQSDAKGFEKKRDELLESVEKHEHRHHRLTFAAMLLEMGIAISTIAIITRKKYWWLSSVALGLAGTATMASAFLMM